MSIVPYRSDQNDQIVFHDPANQIVVVHNDRDNTLELLNNWSSPSPPENVLSNSYWSQPREQSNSPDACCPNCGVNLTDFLSSRKRRSYSNRSGSGEPSGRANNSAREQSGRLYPTLAQSGLTPGHFMHHDYFNLLASLPFEIDDHPSRALEAPPMNISDTKLSNDLFNQGYFERFFRKIPPGILGSGAHSQVYKVAHVLKDFQLGVFAVKRINIGDHSQYLEHVLNEVLILYELSLKGANENNLIRYNHVWMEYGDVSDSSAYIVGDGSTSERPRFPYVYILQQYCDGGHLEDMIESNFLKEQNMSYTERVKMERLKRRELRHKAAYNPPSQRKWLSDFEIWKFFLDIVTGVAYLHSHGILHRDLKPSNCLLDSKYDVEKCSRVVTPSTAEEFETYISLLPKILVSDFGEGKFISKEHRKQQVSIGDRRGNTGTIEFTDPKLWVYSPVDKHSDHRRYTYDFTQECDIYSLGMILCYLCVGSMPFSEYISDFNNPEKFRADIAKWHETLSRGSFHKWFSKSIEAVKGEYSVISEDFELLIYIMIKGEAGIEKPSAQNVLEYLESMKWRRFSPRRGRSQSGVTIVEMDSSSGIKGSDETSAADANEFVDETALDLIELKDQSQSLFTSKSSESELEINYRKLALVSIYVANLAIIETRLAAVPHVLILKMGIFVTVASQLIFEQEKFEFYLASFWSFSTLYFLFIKDNR